MTQPTITRLESDIWLAEAKLPDFDVRCALILGRSRALVFDTLPHPTDMRLVSRLLAGRELVTVYSHADWDHVWGTAGLPERGGSIIGHASCAGRFAADVPRKLAEMRASDPGTWDDVELIAPTTVFGDALVVEVDPWVVELHHLPGHTSDSIVAWIPQAGVLLGGDAIESPWPLADSPIPLEPWIADLERWAGEPLLKHAVPAHGPLGGRDLPERNAVYLRTLVDGSEYPVPEGVDAFYLEHRERDRARHAGR